MFTKAIHTVSFLCSFLEVLRVIGGWLSFLVFACYGGVSMMRILEVARCEMVITIDQLVPLGKRSHLK